MDTPQKVRIRYEVYCVDCDLPAKKKCRRCGLPLCEHCHHTWTGLCSDCSKCQESRKSNMDNDYAFD